MSNELAQVLIDPQMDEFWAGCPEIEARHPSYFNSHPRNTSDYKWHIEQHCLFVSDMSSSNTGNTRFVITRNLPNEITNDLFSLFNRIYRK